MNAIIIEQFKQVDDVHLIHAIKNILDYALKKEQGSFEVSEAHQKLVMERFEKVRIDPDRLLDWDEAKKKQVMISPGCVAGFALNCQGLKNGMSTGRTTGHSCLCYFP